MSDNTHKDGRRQRTVDSRARIIQAMLDLVQDGVMIPNAEQVAERAEVGLRSVFRHFKDMDSLFQELTVLIEADARATFFRPMSGETVEARLADLIERRCALFERISPFQLASIAHWAKSEFLRQDAQRQVLVLRELLKQTLTPEIIANFERFEALDALLSFSTWTRLRQQQGLGFGQAKTVIESTARLLIG
jgi:DNA-binding transcriptional regulator YbjK